MVHILKKNMPLVVVLYELLTNYLDNLTVRLFQENENSINPVTKRNKCSNQKCGI